MSRAMADLLSNRADAYVRFYFRVRGSAGCCSTTCIGTPFFLRGIDAQQERSFSSSAIKNSSGAKRALRDSRWHTPGAYFSTPCRHRNRRGWRPNARFAVSGADRTSGENAWAKNYSARPCVFETPRWSTPISARNAFARGKEVIQFEMHPRHFAGTHFRRQRESEPFCVTVQPVVKN